MSTKLAYFNGHFVPEDQARLSLNDRGFTWGATVTDRCRTYQRKLFRWEEHLARFRHSCDLCRIPQPLPDTELTLYAEHLLEENRGFADADDEFVIILVATPGESPPNLGITSEPIRGSEYRHLLSRGARLVTPATHHVPNDCIPRNAKMRSRMFWWIAEQQAHDFDPDASALLLDLDGHVTETTAANFAIVRNGTIFIPPRSVVLDGISMRVVEELCDELGISFAEKVLTLDECYAAEEALLTSTPFGLAGVSSINGKSIPWPGPILKQLHDAWSERVGMDIWHQISPDKAGC